VLNGLYRWWSALVFLLVIVQVGFAGYGAFSVAHDTDNGGTVDEDSFEDSFGLHAGFGYLVVLSGLILLAIGVAAGKGKWRLGRHGLLGLLLIVQVLLAWIAFDTPEIGFLHPVNALVIFTLSGWIAWSQWKESRTIGGSAAA
jgi:hypothetical protein